MGGGIITALEAQKHSSKRVNVYLDGKYAFSLSVDEAAKLHTGQALAEEDVAVLRAEDEIVRAVDSAARFLAMRPRSEQEVRRNLSEKGVAEPVIEAAVERLRALGYLDDRAFADFWVRDRNAFKPISPKALRYELRQKGVPDAIIGETLAEVDAGEAAYNAAQSQTKRLRGLDKRAFRDRLAGFLQRRGFAYQEARGAIQRIMDELEETDPDFFNDPQSAASEDSWADD